MKELLSCAMDIGEQMLISGAEVHRVEESVRRMCCALGAERTDVFIITSSMMATVYDNKGGSYTQTRRILTSNTDFERLHELNRLSREICENKLDCAQIKERLQRAVSNKPYPFYIEILVYALIAGAFTVFFGGDLAQTLVSFFIGAIVRVGIAVTNRVTANKIFSKFISSVIATALAFLAVGLGIIGDVDKVIIGNIMSFIPGVGFTNALRDLFTGDSIAGILRTIEAVLIAISIAAGYFLVSILGGALI